MIMNKYRIIEIKDRHGFPWYVPQQLSSDDTWESVGKGYLNKEGAFERIAQVISQKVVWDGTEEDVLRLMNEHQEKYKND